MDNKTIEQIQARLEAEDGYHKDLASYNQMVNLEWTLPQTWQTKDWIRKQVSTDGHDAIKQATNIYDTNNPKWDILPRGQADLDSAEKLETVLEWWMMNANKMGGGEPFRKALHNSCLQNRVIYQLDYLPYWLPKNKDAWSREQKAAMKMSHFCIIVHDALNVYFEMGKYGLRWAAAVTCMYAQEIIDHWSVYENNSTEDGKKITAALAKIKAELDENEDLEYIHVDFTSHEKREVSGFKTTNHNLDAFENYEPGGEGRLDILDCKNELEFINWVIVTGESQPMLYSLHKAGIWENQNIYNTIIDSTTMRRAVFPILKHTSPTGKSLDVDYTGAEDVVELTNGEQADVMMPPPIDPAMSQLSASNTAKASQTTGIKGLASIEIQGNVQYAAVQAVIQMHMTNLVPYVRTWEKANAQLGDLAFMWLQQGEGYTEVGYRTKNKGEGKAKGDGIVVSPEDFDPDMLYITCRAVAKTLTDKMQEANFYATLKNAGAHIAWKQALENLSLGNGDVLEAEWLEEQTTTIALEQKVKQLDAQLQQMVKEQDAQLQMQMQQAQMQAQAAQVAPQGQGTPPGGPPGQVPPDQSNPMIPNGQGMNAAAGGEPTATSMPGSNSPVQ